MQLPRAGPADYPAGTAGAEHLRPPSIQPQAQAAEAGAEAYRGALASGRRCDVGEGKFLEAVRDIDPQQRVTCAMKPGDTLIMHNLTLHRSTENRSDGIRWSIDLRFYAPDTPSRDDLLWGFPRPWQLTDPTTTSSVEWQRWYQDAPRDPADPVNRPQAQG